VLETGVGGRRDITTVVDTRVAVITNVGLDHRKTLGPTLQDIAWHKVGIIRPGCRAVVFAPERDVVLVEAARRAARETDAPLRLVRPGDLSTRIGQEGTIYVSYLGRRLQLHDAPLALRGRVQADNAALALAACEELDPDGRWVTATSARAGLARARLPARQEWIMPHERYVGPSPPCAVLIDGAHNDDKLHSLIDGIAFDRFERIHLVYGTLHAKETDDALDRLTTRASSIVLTEPRVYGKAPRPANTLATRLAQRHGIAATVERDPERALDHALCRAKPAELVVVTGSFYLAGMLRSRWYPEGAVLCARTSWPVPRDDGLL